MTNNLYRKSKFAIIAALILGLIGCAQQENLRSTHEELDPASSRLMNLILNMRFI